MIHFVFDSNIVHANSQGTIIFSNLPKIDHATILKGYHPKRIALFVSRRLITSDWIKHEDTYLSPK